ncbi:MAG: hypothetical protein SPL50_06980 [Alloprevotella sp.]|nr:hypothetical protein [Alloprevotella sp.]
MKRILMALVIGAIWASMYAQEIKIGSISKNGNGKRELVVMLEDAGSDNTAMQFGLSLSGNVSLNAGEVVAGSMLNEHELAVRPLGDGDYLFVIYSMDLALLNDGELLRIPFTIDASSDQKAAEAKIYNFRVSTVDGWSSKGKNTSAMLLDGINHLNATWQAEDLIYDISGRQVQKADRPGIFIVGHRKVMVK